MSPPVFFLPLSGLTLSAHLGGHPSLPSAPISHLPSPNPQPYALTPLRNARLLPPIIINHHQSSIITYHKNRPPVSPYLFHVLRYRASLFHKTTFYETDDGAVRRLERHLFHDCFSFTTLKYPLPMGLSAFITTACNTHETRMKHSSPPCFTLFHLFHLFHCFSK